MSNLSLFSPPPVIETISYAVFQPEAIEITFNPSQFIFVGFLSLCFLGMSIFYNYQYQQKRLKLFDLIQQIEKVRKNE